MANRGPRKKPRSDCSTSQEESKETNSRQFLSRILSVKSSHHQVNVFQKPLHNHLVPSSSWRSNEALGPSESPRLAATPQPSAIAAPWRRRCTAHCMQSECLDCASTLRPPSKGSKAPARRATPAPTTLKPPKALRLSDKHIWVVTSSKSTGSRWFMRKGNYVKPKEKTPIIPNCVASVQTLGLARGQTSW